MVLFFFFKQKTAYEMRISDWSSDVCSSDLQIAAGGQHLAELDEQRAELLQRQAQALTARGVGLVRTRRYERPQQPRCRRQRGVFKKRVEAMAQRDAGNAQRARHRAHRPEEPTSELQSTMRHSAAVFC